MPKLNKVAHRLALMRGNLADAIKVTSYFYEGELLWIKDKGWLFIGQGSNPSTIDSDINTGNQPIPVQTLDMAVVHSDGIVTDGGDVVYHAQ